MSEAAVCCSSYASSGMLTDWLVAREGGDFDHVIDYVGAGA